MKKVHKRGFMLAETITVSVVVLTALILIYTQFVSINRSYQNSFRYNTIDKLYAVNNILEYIKTEKTGDLINQLTTEYVDITDCSLFTEFKYCENLFNNLNVKQVLFTKEDTSDLKKTLKNDDSMSEEMKNYIKVLGIDNEMDRYRLIVEFKDNTFASLKTDKIDKIIASQKFEYTGSVQTFVAPISGKYKIELWGASGGDFTNVTSSDPRQKGYFGGKGAYTSGEIMLNKDEVLYIYVGSKGMDKTDIGGYNGGGPLIPGQQAYGSSGGGATDVRTVSGLWNNEQGLLNRIMVASGGGGANNRNYADQSCGYGAGDGGSGGTIKGINGETINHTNSVGCTYGYSYGTGGSQNKGGSSISNTNVITETGGFGVILPISQSGGGGGYYAGGGTSHGGAGGGSSFISGYKDCNAIAINSTLSNIVHTNQPNHFSGKIFTNGIMIDGNNSMPNPIGSNFIIGNVGNGYAKITIVI